MLSYSFITDLLYPLDLHAGDLLGQQHTLVCGCSEKVLKHYTISYTYRRFLMRLFMTPLNSLQMHTSFPILTTKLDGETDRFLRELSG